PPTQSSKETQTRPFGFPIQWIRLDEQAYPKPIHRGIGHPHDQPIENVADQGAEQRCALVRRPIRTRACEQRQDREWAKKPPENAIAKSPTHGGAVTANVTLEQQPE